jgi:asparagine synthase (glutamine-hydrolysing)
MCGITALFQKNSTLTSGLLRQMSDIIAHRGPDGEGYALGSNGEVNFFRGPLTPPKSREDLVYLPDQNLPMDVVEWTWALGHRRLSILDVSEAGHQPMSTADQRYVMSYNGEVYNYIEIREELMSLGWVFKSHSDSEVVLAAYAQWGAKCLSHFNGMFAIVIVDMQENKFFAARDRFGVKPLYIAVGDGYIALASEIKQFTVLPDWSPRLNPQTAYDFLNTASTNYSASTLFAEVTQIRVGHYLEHSLDEDIQLIQQNAWYELNAKPQYLNLKSEEAAEAFSEKFTDAVRLRLRSDVPVGTALSGGLDSSAIVCEVSHQLRQRGGVGQKSFSNCSIYEKYDERKFIDVVVDAAKVEPHYVYPSDNDLVDDFARLAWHQDEPFAGPSIFAEWKVFQLVQSQGIKVTLDGHGSDEHLCGYHMFFWIYLNQLLKQGQVGQWIDELRALQQIHGYTLSHMLRQQMVYALPTQFIQPARNFFRNESASVDLLANQSNLNVHTDPVRDRLRLGSNNLQLECKQQLTVTSMPMQLQWSDRSSMAHSVESRYPFLDYRLVEFVMSVRPEAKLSQGLTKRLLRKGLAHRLPPVIANRQDKMGYVTPESIWLRDQKSQWFLSFLTDHQNYAQTLVSSSAIDRAMRIFTKQDRYNAFAWRVVSLIMWGLQFKVKPSQEKTA